MAKGKHRISETYAKQLTEQMKKKKTASKSPFKELPDGFSFDLKEVRDLMNHPDGVHFVVQLGWGKKINGSGSKENLTPILCIADKDYKIIAESGIQKNDLQAKTLSADTTELQAMSLTSFEEDSNDAGGFLDEADPFPPPATNP